MIRPSLENRHFRGGHGACTSTGMLRDNLEARTARFAVAIFAVSNSIRNRPGGRRAADQLLDCATSVAANYRASARARSPREFVAKLGVVNEEADEAVYWLEFVLTTDLGAANAVGDLLAEAKELRAIFSASCATAKRNARNRRRKRP